MEKVIKEVPQPQRQRLDRLTHEMLGHVTLDIDIATMTRRLFEGMPDKRLELEDTFRMLGWGEAMQGY
jgi:hypothetical protein